MLSRWKIAAFVAGAVVLVLLGYGAGVFLSRPHTPGIDSPEAGFARDMSEHHAQAVEMGMIAYQKATLPEVRAMGSDIAMTQQAQIGMMQAWLTSWGLPLTSSARPMAWMPDGERALDGNRMPGMATREEIAKLRNATGSEVDILFCQLMLRHHQGGIHMVDELLKLNPAPEVRELAMTMKVSQSGEIVVLNDLLTRLGAKPLPSVS